MQYRADIDSLRAIAVLLVLFYHAGFPFIQGGFIGVDIFFVLSGYLLTNIIYKEINEKQFSYVVFYKRRVKRIFPVFFLVGFITVYIGQFILQPHDLSHLWKSLMAATFFSSNMYFWQSSGGYFSQASDLMPLLHTWSLGVEEQFYFILPTALLVASRFFSKERIFTILLISLPCLFITSQWLAINKPSAAYFLLPSRIGELLIGSLLVFTPKSLQTENKTLSSILSISGLIIIFACSVTLSKQDIFPGYYALLPCLGAAMIIYAGPFKMLENKVLVYIGLLSYSLYLWHWPIIAYIKYLQYDLNILMSLAIVCFSILLSILSYHYFEKPLRYRKWNFTQFLMVCYVVPASLIVALTTVVIFTQDKQNQLLRQQTYAHLQPGTCHLTTPAMPDTRQCILGNNKHEPRTFLWGDSHANAYTGVLNTIYETRHESFINLTHDACPPFLDTSLYIEKTYLQTCLARNKALTKMLKDKNKINTVIMSGAWLRYLELAGTEGKEDIINGLRNSIDLILQSNKQPVITLEVPRYNIDIERAHFNNHSPLANTIRTTKLLTEYVNDNTELFHIFKAIANEYPALRFADFNQVICSDGLCKSDIQNVVLYKDKSHITWPGGELIGQKFMALNSNHFEYLSFDQVMSFYQVEHLSSAI